VCFLTNMFFFYILHVFPYFLFIASGYFYLLINYFPLSYVGDRSPTLPLIFYPVSGCKSGLRIQSSSPCCTCSSKLMTIGHYY
jgi:hypothetical protein